MKNLKNMIFKATIPPNRDCNSGSYIVNFVNLYRYEIAENL